MCYPHSKILFVCMSVCDFYRIKNYPQSQSVGMSHRMDVSCRVKVLEILELSAGEKLVQGPLSRPLVLKRVVSG